MSSCISLADSSSEDEVIDVIMMCAINRAIKKRCKRKYWIHPLNLMQPSKGAFSLTRELDQDAEKFKQFYRMCPSTFRILSEILGEKLRKKDTNFRLAVPVEERLLITLRFLATGTNFRAMSFNFLRGETTIRKIVYETCAVIWDELKDSYMPTPQRKDWQNIATQYKNLWQMPNCIGSIDGKHIRISRPKNSGSAFINYNSYFSIVLLAVVDAESLFTIVSIGDFGRNSDGGVFRNSPFGQMLKNGSLNIPPPVPLPGETLPFPHYFVADEAFPLQEHIMRPYPGKGIANNKKIFNNRLSRARKSVECAFGRLASKFRVLYTRMCIDPQNAQCIVQAACILHNFIAKNEKCQADGNEQVEDFADSFQPLSRRGSSQANFNRDRLMEHFLKEENTICGQNRYCT